MACLAYLLSPLSRGDMPRWDSALLVAMSGMAGIGLSIAVYNFHRKTSSFAAEENYNDGRSSTTDNNDDDDDANKMTISQSKLHERELTLRIHAILSSLFSILSITLAIFFGAFASELDKCAHESCGADVSWSCITLGTSIVWMGITFLGYRHYFRRRRSLSMLPGRSDKDDNDELMVEVP